MERGRKMSTDNQFLKDVEFISGQFLCADLPKDWYVEDKIDQEVFYKWIEDNAWYPYDDWTGEKIYDAIVDFAVDMSAYIEVEKKQVSA